MPARPLPVQPYSVGELSKLLGVSQQAASKTVAELTRSGYLESETGEDARVRLVRLSARGLTAVQTARRVRERLERRLSSKLGPRRVSALRASLLDELDATQAVEGRRIPSGEGAS